MNQKIALIVGLFFLSVSSSQALTITNDQNWSVDVYITNGYGKSAQSGTCLDNTILGVMMFADWLDPQHKSQSNIHPVHAQIGPQSSYAFARSRNVIDQNFGEGAVCVAVKGKTSVMPSPMAVGSHTPVNNVANCRISVRDSGTLQGIYLDYSPECGVPVAAAASLPASAMVAQQPQPTAATPMPQQQNVQPQYYQPQQPSAQVQVDFSLRR